MEQKMKKMMKSDKMKKMTVANKKMKKKMKSSDGYMKSY